MASARIRHIGICVTDLERSSTFYREALGFEPLMDPTEVGAPFDALLEMPGETLQIQQLRCGDTNIELLAFPGAGVTGSTERKPMNQLGFTHLTFDVDDIDAAAERVSAHGGAVLSHTRVDSPFGPILFCTDPDGVRIELMQPPG